MTRYSVEPRTKKHVERYGFLSFAIKYKKQLLHTGTDSLKPASKKLVHKTVEFMGNKIADAVTNLLDDKIGKTNAVEEIIIPTEKREKILNELRQVL